MNIKDITAADLRKTAEKNKDSQFTNLLQHLVSLSYDGKFKCDSYTINRLEKDTQKRLEDKGFIVKNEGMQLIISW